MKKSPYQKGLKYNMNEIYEIFSKTKNETQTHFNRLRTAIKRIKNAERALTGSNIKLLLDNEDSASFLDQVVYRFSKLQDSLGKLIRFYLSLRGENIDGLSMIDMINLSEKIGIDITADKWLELRRLRNILTHEYEEEHQKIAGTINKVCEEIPYLEKIIGQLEVKL